MFHGLLLLAEGFEHTEALASLDTLHRTGEIEVTLASITSSFEVTSSSGVKVLASCSIDEIDPRAYDFLILPGGKLGVENLANNAKVLSLVRYFYEEKKIICAICAAPSILGDLGYLDGKNYTCFPGFERGKGTYIDAGAVIDGDIITGHSMGYSIEFGEAIIKKLLGSEAVERIQKGIKGLR